MWEYDDYIEIEDTLARETRLRQHIQEVTSKISATITKAGSSRSSTDLVSLRAQLRSELRELINTNRGRRGTVFGFANLNGA